MIVQIQENKSPKVHLISWMEGKILNLGENGCSQLRWQLLFCMRTCNIFSLGEWFLTFFVHTDFYSFTVGKNTEFDLRISHKPRIQSSWNLDRECITSWRTTVASFSSIQCTVFKKIAIITYNQFTFFSKSVMWFCLIFGVEMHYRGIYWLTKV